MKKSLIITIAVIVVSAAGLVIWGWAGTGGKHDSIQASQAKAVTVDTSSPEKAARSYLILLDEKKYDEAAKLQTSHSKKRFAPVILKENSELMHTTETRLAKIFPARVEDRLAVVGNIQLVRIMSDQESPIVGLNVLNNWEIANDITEIDQSKIRLLQTMLLEHVQTMFDNKLSNASLNNQQQKQLNSQYDSIIKFLKQQLDNYGTTPLSKNNKSY